jgi:hypothetical protein
VTLTLHTSIGMLVAAALIGVASWIGKRWGAGAGGWFVALPLISGPIVLTYALERGAAFAAQACLGALLATISLSAFALVYAWCARGAGWLVSCALACVAFLASTWALQHFRAPAIGWTFVIACAVISLSLALMPAGSSAVRRSRSPVWDIPLRMILAAALVWILATVSGNVGPRVSGLLTPFPITSSILVSFMHHGEGAASASRFLRGLLKGLFSFAVFVLVVGATIGSRSVAVAFGVATLVTIVFHAGVWHWVQHPVPAPSAPGTPRL